MSGVSPSSLGALPPVLAVEAWRARHGVLAAELSQLHRLVERIDARALSLEASRPRTLAALERAMAAVSGPFRARVLPVLDQARAVERAARKAGVGEVAAAAAALVAELDEAAWTARWEAEAKALRAAIEAASGRTERMVDDAAARLLRAGRGYEAGPQRAQDWQALIRPEGHRLSQIVSALPDYRSRFWHRFKMFQSFDIEALKLDGSAEIDRTKRQAVLREALRQAEAIADHRPE